MNPYASALPDPNYLGMYADPMLTGTHHHGLHAGGFADYHAAAAYSTPLANSDQEYQQTQSVLTDGGHQYPVAATCFDNHEELLWSSNQGGHVTSYYGVHLQKYTSFQVHQIDEVRALLPLNSPRGCLLVLTPSSVRCQMKRGLPVFTHMSKTIQDMCSLIQSPRDTVIMGGNADRIIDFDVNMAKELRVVHLKEEHTGGCPILRLHPRLICSGSARGGVRLHDPNSLEVVNTIDCHSGSLSDLDVQGDTVVTVGFRSTSYGSMVSDPFVKVYDVRMMKALPPVSLAIDHPLLLRFLPSYSSRLLVMSATGRAQIIDPSQQKSENNSILQVNVPPEAVVQTLAISPSCQCYAVGTSDGYLHLSITNDGAVFHTHPEETEFGTYPYPTPVAPISYNDFLTSLASVPFPIPIRSYEDEYHQPRPLSAWPGTTANKIYRRAPSIDPEIVKSMKIVQSIGYFPNTGSNHRARQIPYKIRELTERGAAQRGHPLGRVGGQRRMDGEVGERGSGQGEDGVEAKEFEVPKRYRKLEVKYSKLGFEDFDYARFNQTAFCGLESLLPNAYCNALLQVLYFVAPLRGPLLSHICEREFCIACELGFLFHMLDQSGESPCQPANFLRAFRTLPEAQALSLILNDQDQAARKGANLKLLIQNWNRFVLQQIHTELKEWKRKGVSFMDCIKKAIDAEDTKKKGSLIINNNAPASKEDGPASEDKKSSAQSSFDESSASTLSDASEGVKNDENVQEKDKPVNDADDEASELSDLFGCVQRSSNSCTVCQSQTSKRNLHLSCHVSYPPKRALDGSEDKKVSFQQVLEKSLNFDQTNSCWCEGCKKYRPTKMTRRFESIPYIWAMNCGLTTDEDVEFFKDQLELARGGQEVKDPTQATKAAVVETPKVTPCRFGAECKRPFCRYSHDNKSSGTGTSSAEKEHKTSWIPEFFIVRWLNDGQVRVLPLDPKDVQPTMHRIRAKYHSPQATPFTTSSNSNSTTKSEENKENEVKKADPEGTKEEVVYSLQAVVSHISDPAHPDKNNLVSAINVGPTYHQRMVGSAVNQWYLFNDFSITPITREEATWFDARWKLPAVLYYSRVTADPDLAKNVEKLEGMGFPNLSIEVLKSRSLVPRQPSSTNVTFLPVQPEEIFKKGDVVAIDAEFVTLNQEDMELRSDGTKATIKPSLLSVARISVLRGSGPMIGVPFIDDYISTQSCQVVDYLTKFSGIMPGDLDANFSSKHLTTLKNAYLKLRYLADMGVIFIGHGLKNDFRVINLVVKPEQLEDTVILYRLPHQRMVSLRFLAWYFLDRKIQAFNHDSIEDARAALDLWRKYKDMVVATESGKGDAPDAMLRKLYACGRELNWKVPGVDDD